MDTGIKARLEILHRDAEMKILQPLRTHGWSVDTPREVATGDGHIIYGVGRGSHRRTFALLYSSGTANATYKSLEAQGMDHILVNGGLQNIASYAAGIKTPISSADDFLELMIDWNRATSEGKFADNSTDDPVEEKDSAASYRVLLSETPIEAIWLRLRQFQSVRIAAKQIRQAAASRKIEIDDATLNSKAEGVAFALRNASDYYSASQTRNVSQRILNLYYGTMAFAFAEILARPDGPSSLAAIEEETKRGHGLFTLDGKSDDVSDLVVGIMRTGFFSYCLGSLGKDLTWTPKQKAKDFASLSGLPADSYVTLAQLFARIPEVGDLFLDVFDSPVQWLRPAYDTMANHAGFPLRGNAKVTRAYGTLTDVSGKLTLEEIGGFPGPISELKRVSSLGQGARYRMAVDYEGHENLWGALTLHRSPLGSVALIKPLFKDVSEYRLICLALLYALSIIVRYRPSIWRRVQEGDLDHMRILIEAFLAVVERVLPEQYLERASGTRIHAKQPGSMF